MTTEIYPFITSVALLWIKAFETLPEDSENIYSKLFLGIKESIEVQNLVLQLYYSKNSIISIYYINENPACKNMVHFCQNSENKTLMF